MSALEIIDYPEYSVSVNLGTGMNHTADEVTAFPAGCKMKQIDLSTDAATVVCAGPAILRGVYVDVVLSAHAVVISDGGVTIKTLVASSAVGNIPCYDLEFASDITVTPNASSTGTISVFYIEL